MIENPYKLWCIIYKSYVHLSTGLIVKHLVGLSHIVLYIVNNCKQCSCNYNGMPIAIQTYDIRKNVSSIDCIDRPFYGIWMTVF